MPSLAPRLLPSAPGTSSYPTWGADLGRALSEGFSAYQGNKRQIRDKALKNLITRGELTGDFGKFSPTEQAALQELGITDTSALAPTELGRKLKQVKAISPSLAGLSRVEQSLMGIKNPVEDIIKTEKQRQEMAKAAGLKDLPPTAVYQKHFEESTGVPYPKVQVPDPVTGQVAERAAPYLIDNTKTREKLNKEVGAAIWAAQQKWADPSNPSTYELAKGRVVAEGELQAKLGLNWKEQLSSAPDMAQQFESVFTPKEEPAPPVKEASPKENATMAFFKGMMETIQGMPNLASNVGSAIKSVVTDAMPKRPALAMPRKGTTSRGLTYTVE